MESKLSVQAELTGKKKKEKYILKKANCISNRMFQNKKNGLMLKKLNPALTLMCDYVVRLRLGSVKVTDLLLHHMKGSITFN